MGTQTPEPTKPGQGGGPYSPCEYLVVADRLDGASPDECHPALYERRHAVADRLRRMAHESPDATASRRVLDGVRFLCYRLRR
jgi:hypothetical protein